jgi:tartrate dehydratase beta subunit/fumarate hydratase class I family protein
MIKNLQHFIGKVCTIFTQPINRNFKEENPETYPEQPYIYFVGVVEAIDEYGVLITQPTTGLKSYFFLRNLVGIAEEEVLDPKNEKDAKTIDHIKNANAEIRQKMDEYKNKNTKPIQIDEMNELLKKAEEKAQK